MNRTPAKGVCLVIGAGDGVGGAIHDVPTVEDLIERIVSEAEALVSERLRSAMKPAALAA